jgi:hypothetical protein
MKRKLLLFISIFLFFATLSVGQKKIFHENGKVAYDSTFHTVYYSSGARAFNPSFNTVYYDNGKAAYRNDYKNIYYSNGSIAYNAMNKNVYYSNGNLAYDSRTRTGFDKSGKDGQNLTKTTEGGYSIEEEGLKVMVDKNNQFKFELVLQDVGFFYVTDFKTYFNIMSGTLADNRVVNKVKLN